MAGAPLALGRGVVAPSMAWSSVEAELFTGRKEAMMGRRKRWRRVMSRSASAGGVKRQNQPCTPVVAKPATRSASLESGASFVSRLRGPRNGSATPGDLEGRKTRESGGDLRALTVEPEGVGDGGGGG